MAHLWEESPSPLGRVALPPFHCCATGRTWASDELALCRGGVGSRVAQLVPVAVWRVGFGAYHPYDALSLHFTACEAEDDNS